MALAFSSGCCDGMERGKRPQGNKGRLFAWVTGGFLLLPTARAQAHTTFPGLGEFASGLLHPLTTPLHLLVLLALGLWLGQYAPLRLKGPAAIFAAFAAVGLLATVGFHLAGFYPPLLMVVGLVIGAGVAIGIPAPAWIRLSVCAVAALLLGLDSGVDPGTPPLSAAKILAATWVGLVLCVVNAAFYVSLLPGVYWLRIGVRVLGSWIVAIAMLMLAFALRR